MFNKVMGIIQILYFWQVSRIFAEVCYYSETTIGHVISPINLKQQQQTVGFAPIRVASMKLFSFFKGRIWAY